ncbi:MAG TPA: hypothetical protein VFF11_10990 [Candidatus Binatia bacterium]|nr:hypothetical protein [Candidatus Binatia bacterium]
MKSCIILLAAGAFIAVVGCRPSGNESSSLGVSTNDTSHLDSLAHENPKASDFVHRFKTYYSAIEKQDWPTTYDMRVDEFKHDVTRDFYLKEMAEYGKNWRLRSYKVIELEMSGGTNGNFDGAALIVQFKENRMVNYSTVRWKKQRGVWLCDEPGLSDALLHSTRISD